MVLVSVRGSDERLSAVFAELAVRWAARSSSLAIDISISLGRGRRPGG